MDEKRKKVGNIYFLNIAFFSLRFENTEKIGTEIWNGKNLLLGDFVWIENVHTFQIERKNAILDDTS